MRAVAVPFRYRGRSGRFSAAPRRRWRFRPLSLSSLPRLALSSSHWSSAAPRRFSGGGGVRGAVAGRGRPRLPGGRGLTASLSLLSPSLPRLSPSPRSRTLAGRPGGRRRVYTPRLATGRAQCFVSTAFFAPSICTHPPPPSSLIVKPSCPPSLLPLCRCTGSATPSPRSRRRARPWWWPRPA